MSTIRISKINTLDSILFSHNRGTAAPVAFVKCRKNEIALIGNDAALKRKRVGFKTCFRPEFCLDIL